MSFHLSSHFIKNLSTIFGTKKKTFQKKNHQEIFGDPLFPTASFDPGLNLEPLRECYVLVENCNDEVEDVTIQKLQLRWCPVLFGWAQEDVNWKKVGGNIGIIYIYIYIHLL